MIKNIISFSVRNKLVIGLFVIGLIVLGSYQLTRLPIDAVPDITSNQVQIITVAPSFGATDIERLVTFPIEQASANIAGATEIRSFSRFGLSLVTITFRDDIDVYWARQQVSERLIQVQSQIPPGFGVPELGPVSTGLGEIYQYVVKPKNGFEHIYTPTRLRTIQDWIIRRQLMGVEGVAEVSSFGGKVRQIEVSVHPNKLQANQVTITDILDALEKNNQNTGGAYIEKGPTLQFIRTEGLIGNVEELGLIEVKKQENGLPLLLRDVAEINEGFATRYGTMCYNDEGEVTGAVVMMLKGANSNLVIKNVKDRIEKIRKTLPEGVEIEAFLDRSKMVNHAISTVKTNLLEGALIVVFILVLFLGNLRAGLLVASVIPLSMLFAVIMMNLFGVSGNLMSLGALDFGLIVDGAVIIIEAVLHQLRHRSSILGNYTFSKDELNLEVEETSGKMMNSAITGQIIILIVYLPILTLQGIEGKMFRPMAQTVAFALTGAFLLSLTYIPMMSAFVLNRRYSDEQGLTEKYFSKLAAAFERSLIRAMTMKKQILTGVLVLFTGSMILFSQMGGEFIPQLEEGDFAVETRIMTGSNLQTMVDMVTKASRIIKKEYPEVEKVVTKIGSGEVPTDPMPIEAADMMIILKDKHEWTSASTFPELADKMKASLEVIPGLQLGFQYPVQMRFNELMTGAKQDVVCKIFGENLDTLSHYAHQLGKLIQGIDGVRDLYIESALGMPQVIISFNRQALAQYHVNISEINNIIHSAYAGQTVGMMMEGEKRFDIVVRMKSGLRNNTDAIENLLIPAEGGNQIPLHVLANVRFVSGPNQIQREDAKRRIIIGFNVRNRDVQSIVNELMNKQEQELNLPSGYYVTYGGTFENLIDAKNRLFVAVPVVLLMIFILLFFAFRSIPLGLLIYTAIPLSATGGIYMLALRGMPFSISAGIGFIALFGVAVLNGIVLVAEFKRLKHMDPEHRLTGVIQATKLRLRPVLMTACVASFGFLPMALSNGAGAEVQRPLATVVIGGLILSTFLTLYVLPILFVLISKPRKGIEIPGVLLWLILGCVATGLIPVDAQAQQSLTLNDCIRYSIKNNLSYQEYVLQTDYGKSLTRTSFDPPKTLVSAEYGQINSLYRDNRFTVVQSFSFPGIYITQNRMLKAGLKERQSRQDLKEQELIRAVRFGYYNIQFLREKVALWNNLDSLYRIAINISNTKLLSGESNRLESKVVSTQSEQAAMQGYLVQMEYANAWISFKQLLNLSDSFHIEPALAAIPDSLLSLTPQANDHPQIKSLESVLVEAQQLEKLQKLRYLPEITLGYNNMTMIGSGADGVTYSQNSRFQSAQIGLSLPLFMQSQKSLSRAAEIRTAIRKNQLQAGKQEWQTSLVQTLNACRKSKELLNRYEVLRNDADLITNAATLQFNSGAITYLNWLTLIQQAVDIRIQHLDALNRYNQHMIQLQFLMNR